MARDGSDLLQQASKPFSIIEEFAVLSAKRKVLLCDHLFGESRQTFRNTIKLLWPEASILDMKKLESFLILLRKAVPKR
ncbi:MAG: hypothetical protein WBK55_04200 [Alphaproteobacteria bacterium]